MLPLKGQKIACAYVVIEGETIEEIVAELYFIKRTSGWFLYEWFLT
jgi:hypothetical protein